MFIKFLLTFFTAYFIIGTSFACIKTGTLLEAHGSQKIKMNIDCLEAANTAASISSSSDIDITIGNDKKSFVSDLTKNIISYYIEIILGLVFLALLYKLNPKWFKYIKKLNS